MIQGYAGQRVEILMTSEVVDTYLVPRDAQFPAYPRRGGRVGVGYRNMVAAPGEVPRRGAAHDAGSKD